MLAALCPAQHICLYALAQAVCIAGHLVDGCIQKVQLQHKDAGQKADA